MKMWNFDLQDIYDVFQEARLGFKQLSEGLTAGMAATKMPILTEQQRIFAGALEVTTRTNVDEDSPTAERGNRTESGRTISGTEKDALKRVVRKNDSVNVIGTNSTGK